MIDKNKLCKSILRPIIIAGVLLLLFWLFFTSKQPCRDNRRYLNSGNIDELCDKLKDYIKKKNKIPDQVKDFVNESDTKFLIFWDEDWGNPRIIDGWRQYIMREMPKDGKFIYLRDGDTMLLIAPSPYKDGNRLYSIIKRPDDGKIKTSRHLMKESEFQQKYGAWLLKP